MLHLRVQKIDRTCLFDLSWGQGHFTILAIGTAVYVLFSLELYTSAIAILLPIALPVLTFWSFVLLTLLPRKT